MLGALIGWAVNGRREVTEPGVGGCRNASADSLAPSPARELFALPPGVGEMIQPYVLAPDGNRFLVQSPVSGSRPLEVIVNWLALLKQ